MKYILDTHILIWWFEERERLKKGQREVLDQYERWKPFGVSDVTLLEIGCLHEQRRITLSMPLRDWLDRATAGPLVQLCRITAATVEELTRLPEELPRDPADRIIVATARLQGATLLTCDARILAAKAVATL